MVNDTHAVYAFSFIQNNLQHTDYKLLITNAEVAKK